MNITKVMKEGVKEFERLFRVATPYRTIKEWKQKEWLHTHQQELLLAQLEWFEEMVNRHDPMANKKSNPNYWGNTLRLELSDLKAHLTKDIKSNENGV